LASFLPLPVLGMAMSKASRAMAGVSVILARPGPPASGRDRRMDGGVVVEASRALLPAYVLGRKERKEK
jgi:hypothetical protein